MHISVPVANTMEYINATQVSPLVSHVQIKVCYVGQDPNRNGSVITKEVATKLGEKLPGCPIVGYYDDEIQDFASHNRDVVVEDGKFKIIDMTKPYGFVDIGAKVWFEQFSDEGVIHEYLCTEGYVWTGVYEESKRVVEKGNNQSMELSEDYENGFWTNDLNSGKRIFIINDGLIEKLCILGEDVEPCFEGAQIKSFSLTSSEFEEFKSTMFSMINELKDTLSKGGSEETMDKDNGVLNPEVEEETNVEFEKKKPEDEEEQKKTEDTSTEEDSKPEDDKSKEEDPEDEEKKKKSYSLDEIPEYVELKSNYEALQTQYAALEQEKQDLDAEVQTLRGFKLSADRKSKEDMINSFFMLSDEDKKDVVDHIDTYSLDDIEAKLSIICVRNKVDFKLGQDEEEDPNPEMLFNLNDPINNNDSAPAWVKAVRLKQEQE